MSFFETYGFVCCECNHDACAHVNVRAKERKLGSCGMPGCGCDGGCMK